MEHRDCIRSRRVQPPQHSINAQIKHTQEQCVSHKSDGEEVSGLLFLVPGLKGSWRAYLLEVFFFFFLSSPGSQARIHVLRRALIFLQASCQIQFMARAVESMEWKGGG